MKRDYAKLRKKAERKRQECFAASTKKPKRSSTYECSRCHAPKGKKHKCKTYRVKDKVQYGCPADYTGICTIGGRTKLDSAE